MNDDPVKVSSLVATAGLSVGAYVVGQNLSGVSGEALASAAPGQAAQVSVNGSELFALNCAGCHGAKAEGRTPSPVMPHFADLNLNGEPLTDAQIEAIHNFIKSL